MRIYVACKETGGFIAGVSSIENGLKKIKEFEQMDKEFGCYVDDFYDVVNENHESLLQERG